MNRSIAIFVLLVVACICLCPYSLVYADEQEPTQGGTKTEDGHTVKSYGNILYKEDGGLVEIRAEDFVFLEEKLSSVPEGAFDPAVFSAPEDISAASMPYIQEISFGDMADEEDKEKSEREAAVDMDETADRKVMGVGQGEVYEEKMEDADEAESDGIDGTENQEGDIMVKPETDTGNNLETEDKTETEGGGDTESTPGVDNETDMEAGNTEEKEGEDSVSSNNIDE